MFFFIFLEVAGYKWFVDHSGCRCFAFWQQNTISYKTDDINSIIKSLNPTKAYGVDNISIRMVQLCGDYISLSFNSLFFIFIITISLLNANPVSYQMTLFYRDYFRQYMKFSYCSVLIHPLMLEQYS